MNETDTNLLNEEQIEETDTSDREITRAEDIELDVLEVYEEKKAELADKEDTPIEEPTEPVVEAKEPLDEPKEVVNKEATAPPASWKAEGKEWFNKQAPEVQAEISRRAKDLDKAIFAVNEEKAAVTQKYGNLDKAIEPYEDEWRAQGIPTDKAISSLAAADRYLKRDLAGGMEFIAKSYGTTVREIADALEYGGESSTQAAPQLQQNNAPLQQYAQDIQYLKDKVQKQEQAEEAKAQEAELAEIHAVRDQQDATGRYLRPEMHDEAFVQTQLGPMYMTLKERYPGQSPSELMEKAYTAVTGKVPQQAPVGLSPTTNRNRAAASVRGTAIAAPAEKPQEVPNSVEETMLQDARALGLL